MAHEDRKDFNAMLRKDNGMPKIQIITDQAAIEKYGGSRMFFAPPAAYDAVMKTIPPGKVTTVGRIRSLFAEQNPGRLYRPHDSRYIHLHCRVGQLSAGAG